MKLLSPSSRDLLQQAQARLMNSSPMDAEKEEAHGDGEPIVKKEKSSSVQSIGVDASATQQSAGDNDDDDGYSVLADLLIADRISTFSSGNALEGLLNRIHLTISCDQLSRTIQSLEMVSFSNDGAILTCC